MKIEQDPRFRHLKKKLALFSIVAVLLLISTVLLVAYKKGFFIKKYELTFTVERGTGFNRGMPVKLSGFRVGKINTISLNKDAKIDIIVEIDKKYQNWIRKDSTAKLIKEGLVGEQIVEISIGSPELAVLESGGQLKHIKTRTLDQLADEITEKVKPVLVDVGSIIRYVNDPEGDLKQLIKNLRELSKNVEETRKKADLLLITANRQVDAVGGRLVTTLDGASTSVSLLNSSLRTIDGTLPQLLASTEKSLKNVEKISGDLKQAEEKVLPRLPGLVKSSEDALSGATTIMNAVKDIWPIRSYLPPLDEKILLPGNSHD
ncbi:MAG TPA: MCE family protein [Desulfuromonadales bacterium]|nr:MCE family protein [Desulfuromonadales bacterium]